MMGFRDTRHTLLACLILLISIASLASVPARAARLAQPARLSVVEVYRHAQKSLTRPGFLYRLVMRGQTVEGPIRISVVRRLWAAPQRGFVRDHGSYTYTFTDPKTHRTQAQNGRSTTITTGQGAFTRSSPPSQIFATDPLVCHGKGLLAADVVLGCPGPTTRSSTAVQTGQYAGRPTVVLVTTGTTEGEDQNTTTTTRLYLDSVTYLPIAGVTTGTMDAGKKYPLHGTAHYSGAFVPVSAVPANWFDPASIGYQPPAVTIGRKLNRLPAGFTAYWLGVRFAGGSGLPPLVISRMEPAGGPGYLFILMYATEDHPYTGYAIALQEFPAGNTGPRSSGACAGHVMERFTLQGGTATIYTVHGLHACAFFKDAIVMVTTPMIIGINGNRQSPYMSRTGLETVLRALQPRAVGAVTS